MKKAHPIYKTMRRRRTPMSLAAVIVGAWSAWLVALAIMIGAAIIRYYVLS